MTCNSSENAFNLCQTKIYIQTISRISSIHLTNNSLRREIHESKIHQKTKRLSKKPTSKKLPYKKRSFGAKIRSYCGTFFDVGFFDNLFVFWWIFDLCISRLSLAENIALPDKKKYPGSTFLKNQETRLKSARKYETIALRREIHGSKIHQKKKRLSKKPTSKKVRQ